MSTQPDQTPPNIKIFDRPEKKGPPPLILALIVLAVLAASFFGYRALVHPAAAPAAPAARTSSRQPYLTAPKFTLHTFAKFPLQQG